MALAESLVAEFGRLVRRDGGEISLLHADQMLIRVGYRSGQDQVCESGACVLPHLELQTMMQETLERRAPGMRVIVELKK